MHYKYETHMHTYESSICGKATAREQVKQYKRNGYDGIIITDHLNRSNFLGSVYHRSIPLITWKQKVDFMIAGYLAAKEAGDRVGLDVFLGWEYRSEDGADFLTYGLDDFFLITHPDLHKMGLAEYSELVHDHGGFIVQAHPYRNKHYRGGCDSPADIRYIDAIEGFNASRIGIGTENIDAMNFATENNIPVQSGTDSHRIDRPFYSGIELPAKARSIFDIISAIRDRKSEMILTKPK